MLNHNPLEVRVNDALTLDAGWWEEVTDEEGGNWRILHPPATTMFEQLLDFLDRNPSPRPDNAYPRSGGEEWATVALCLRWGSYFAGLADEAKPLSVETWNEEISRVDEGEMARIKVGVQRGPSPTGDGIDSLILVTICMRESRVQ